MWSALLMFSWNKALPSELKREKTMANNHAMLTSLGLNDPFILAVKPTTKDKIIKKKAGPSVPPSRTSARLLQQPKASNSPVTQTVAGDYSGMSLEELERIEKEIDFADPIIGRLFEVAMCAARAQDTNASANGELEGGNVNEKEGEDVSDAGEDYEDSDGEDASDGSADDRTNAGGRRIHGTSLFLLITMSRLLN
jgi:hypothetical protein